MNFANSSFEYDPARIDQELPVLIVRRAEGTFYEVKASITMFMKAAEQADSMVTYREVTGGNHNWMTEPDIPASHQAIQAEIAFLKKHL